MDVFSRGTQNVGIILLMCGYLLAVTITPLPYKENRQPKDRQIQGTYYTKGSARITIDEKPIKGDEPGFRIPRGSATFLDQDEGNRIRRQMMAERGNPGFWGGNEVRRDYDERRNYGNYGNRYYGNEIDRDTFYDKKSKDDLYYPNYNPEPSPSNRRDYDCDPRGRPYSGNNGYNGYQGGRGYDNDRSYNRGGGGSYDRGFGGYNGNRDRRYDERNMYQPGYERNRGYMGDQWSGKRGYSGRDQWGEKGRNSDRDQWQGKGYGGDQWSKGGNDYGRDKYDNVGEGTIGFYGRVQRP